MTGITVLVLATLVIVVERRHEREPEMEVEQALSIMGVTPVSGPAPEIDLQSLSDGQENLDDLSGDLIFLNFWATWCAPCVAEMPAMQRLADEFSDDGLSVVAVNVREDHERVRQFVDRLELEYTILLDVEGQVTRDYNIRGYPTTVIIDRDGELIGMKMGFHEWDSAETVDAFAALLEQV